MNGNSADKDGLRINSCVVVIEGDENINPDSLRIALSENMPHIEFVFSCRSTPGHAEPVYTAVNPDYTARVYKHLKLAEMLMSTQARVSSCLASFVDALDRLSPDYKSARSSIEELIKAARDALTEVARLGISEGTTTAETRQGKTREPQSVHPHNANG